ncbi:MAG: hypothetical protein AAGK14_00170 [Verrucomicrobiota bacterium]
MIIIFSILNIVFIKNLENEDADSDLDQPKAPALEETTDEP